MTVHFIGAGPSAPDLITVRGLMLTVVIVGSSHTRALRTGDGREWAYTPRGYDAKAGTRMGEAPARGREAAE